MNRITKGFVTGIAVLALNDSALACPWCRIKVRDGIYDENFVSTLLTLLLPIFVLAAIGFGLYNFDKIKHKIRRQK
jgi:hypothetical protein